MFLRHLIRICFILKTTKLLSNSLKNLSNQKNANELKPNVIRFLDENHLSDINEIMHSKVFKKSAGVLVELSSPEDDEKFLKQLCAKRQS